MIDTNEMSDRHSPTVFFLEKKTNGKRESEYKTKLFTFF